MEKNIEKRIYKDFRKWVNMTPAAFEKWLHTEESKSVERGNDGDELADNKSGEKIIEILKKKISELTDTDYMLMEKVVDYIKRHTAQKPDGDLSETDWNYSLRNRGYDYRKK